MMILGGYFVAGANSYNTVEALPPDASQDNYCASFAVQQEKCRWTMVIPGAIAAALSIYNAVGVQPSDILYYCKCCTFYWLSPRRCASTYRLFSPTTHCLTTSVCQNLLSSQLTLASSASSTRPVITTTTVMVQLRRYFRRKHQRRCLFRYRHRQSPPL